MEEKQPVDIDATKTKSSHIENAVSVLQWDNGGKYEGEVNSKGEMHGKGIYYHNGNKYEGNWLHNQKHGLFKCTFGNGETFEGQFKNDKRNGAGTALYSDGSKYEGEYLDDLRHGRGLYWTPHEYYTVQRLFFRIYDHGTLKTEIERHTDIQKISNRPGFGFGTYVLEDGSRFEGEHENYQKQGRGQILWLDGKHFVGEFRQDKRHGIGMLKTPEGEYSYQEWKEGTLIAERPSDYLNWKNFFWYDEGGADNI
eukprot:GCRY01004800.1.p1 GENE.GCRY01004800.1~~GCRY01004800.1.p1  ORF type:complete len:253 (+),score=33.09 GCRY01004800.1:116-874(+)